MGNLEQIIIDHDVYLNRENQVSTPIHFGKFDSSGKLTGNKLLNTDILYNLLTYQNVGKDLTCDTTITDGLKISIKLFYLILVKTFIKIQIYHLNGYYSKHDSLLLEVTLGTLREFFLEVKLEKTIGWNEWLLFHPLSNRCKYQR